MEARVQLQGALMSDMEIPPLAVTGSGAGSPDRVSLQRARSLSRLLFLLAGATAVCALLVGVTIWFVDRPVSTWMHGHLGDAQFDWFTSTYDGHVLVVGPFSFMAGPAQVLPELAVIAFSILALTAASGCRATMRGRILLILALSIFVAMEVNTEAKAAFGRTWPESWLGNNPSWIHDGIFGFFPFHGGRGWGSFPSGHTTIITAPATVLWVVWPELRVLWASIVGVVVLGLIGANYHFVSDTIGGLYLGALVGLGINGLMLSPQDRLNWTVLLGFPPTIGSTTVESPKKRSPS
jgi:membrane-associated phospholipid phosphatase